MSPLRHLLPLFISACTVLAESPHAVSDRAALLQNVAEITAPGVPGSVCAFGPDAFALVSGKEGRNTRSAVVAAGRWDKGRVVAFGHDGYLAQTTDPGTATLLLNAVKWTGAAHAKPKVAVRAPGPLASFLRESGFETEDLGAESWLTSLARADVLCLDARILRSPDQVAAIGEWVRKGGALVIAGTGWGWASLNPSKRLTADFPANQLLAPAGIVFGAGTPAKTTDRGYGTGDPALPFLNASSSLDALLNPGSSETLESAQVAQTATTVAEAIRSLPDTDSILLPRLTALRSESKNSALPAPGKPLASGDAKARLSLTLDVQEAKAAAPEHLRAHPAADAFPGSVPPQAPRLQRQIVNVDTAVRDWHSTGLYAPPGERITIRIPESAKDKGLSVRIGCHTDSIWHLEKWERVPEISSLIKLTDSETAAASPFGGLIYVVVPRDCKLGPIEVTISGAVQGPRFTLNRTNLQQWRTSIRHAPAPWAELETSKVILTVPSSAIRKLEDPEALLRFWDTALDAIADLAGISRERHRPERIVTDVQISAGYMHSGYPIMTHLDVAERAVTIDQLKPGGWGFWHELGHNHQVPDWTFAGTGEVTCNLFSLYVSELLCGFESGQGHDAMIPQRAVARLAKHLSTRAVFERWKNDPFLALTMYDQLRAAFGWQTYRKVLAEYRTLKPAERPKSDDEKRDQWLVRFSRAAGRNLGPFFEAWGVPTSEGARASVAHLPSWMPADWPTTKTSTSASQL